MIEQQWGLFDIVRYSFQARQKTSSLVERHFRSSFLEACFRARVFPVYQGARFLHELFVFRGVTASRVLRKVTFCSSVRWLTNFCTPTSLGRWRESGRASRNLLVVWKFMARLLMILCWGLSRLFVSIANIINWWYEEKHQDPQYLFHRTKLGPEYDCGSE
jgi:hypothetical protein